MKDRENAPPHGTSPLSTRRVELERLEAQLAEWTAVIGQYRASARRVQAEGRAELDFSTDELQRQRNEAGEQIRRLKSAADAEWEQEKVQLNRLWQAVRAAFLRAEAKFPTRIR